LLPALCALFCVAAWASPRSEAWKLRRSDPAQALAQLQQVVRDDPNDAKAFWFMTLLLKDLNRPSEALQTLQNARRIDPALSFSDNAAGVQKMEQTLQRAVASGATSSTQPQALPSGAPPSGTNQGSAQQLRSEGWKAYKAGDNDRAAQLLAQSLQLNPRDAKTLWFSALVLEDSGRYDQALQTLRAARQVDPSLSFAGNPAAVDKKEQSLVRRVSATNNGATNSGATSTRTGPATTRPSTTPQNFSPNGAPAASRGNGQFSTAQNQEMLRALQQTNVYVEPAMQPYADPAQISAAVRGTNASNIEPKVVVVQRVPAGYANAGQVAERFHQYMAMGNSGLVIVVAGRDVAAYGADLSKEELGSIVQSAARTFDSESFAAGIAQIVRAADQERGQQIANGGRFLLVTGGVLAGGVYLVMRRNRKRQAARLTDARERAQELSSRLAPQLEKLDSDYEYALLDQNDAARTAQLQEYRRAAGQSFSDAMRTLRDAQNAEQFEAALGALQSAEATMQRARNVLQGKPVDEGVQLPATPAMARDALARDALTSTHNGHNGATGVVQVPPLGSDLPGAQPGYALDFFTSQPVPRDQMVPVDLEINGQKRRVWASRDSAQRAAAGDPPIAAIDYGGRPRAWFDVPDYNPWQSFGSQVLQMMTINMLLNQVMGGYSMGSGWSSYGGYGGGWFDSGYHGGYDDGYSAGYNRGHEEYAPSRSDDYDARMHDTSTQAGQASLDSPFSGGSWSGAGSNAGSASLDVFGGSGSSGSGNSSFGRDSS
jgi:tetratricopeptide (TPR) repeat protein